MSWFQYLMQVNLYLILLYGFYILLLQNNTFFKLNRIYLLLSGVSSFLMPLFQLDNMKAPAITEQMRQTTKTVSKVIYSVPQVDAAPQNLETITDFLAAVYVCGMIYFFCRFLLQLFTLYREGEISSDVPKAHSFFGKIVVSGHIEGREVILEHEKVHSRERHSVDVLLFEVIAIVNWFNPVVYALKKAVRHVHEFIADEAVADRQLSKEAYSILLLSNVFGIRTRELSNSFFNQSLLKRRIIMLHKTKTKRIGLLKYCLCIPLLAMMLILSSSTVKITGYSAPIKRKINSLIGSDSVSQSGTYDNSFIERRLRLESLDLTKRHTGTTLPGDEKEEISDLKKNESLKEAEVEYDYLPSPLPSEKKPRVEADDIIPNGQAEPIEDPVWSKGGNIQVLPSFPGGTRGWKSFLEGYHYPNAAVSNNISGKIIFSFIVDKDGSLKDIQVVKDLGFGTGEEVIRLLKASPKWTSGKIDDKAVRLSFTQALTLILE